MIINTKLKVIYGTKICKKKMQPSKQERIILLYYQLAKIVKKKDKLRWSQTQLQKEK